MNSVVIWIGVLTKPLLPFSRDDSTGRFYYVLHKILIGKFGSTENC